MRRSLCLALAWLVPLMATAACGPHESGPPASPAAALTLQEYDTIGGDFALTDDRGGPFALADHRGQVVLLFFGYTFCPDACPMTLSKIAQAMKQVGPAASRDRVLALLVTVDPARDTPDVLREYLAHFSIPAVGLTGTSDELDAVAGQYGASYEPGPATSVGSATVNHSTYLYLIDQRGKLRYIFRHDDGADLIAAGLRRLLEVGT